MQMGFWVDVIKGTLLEMTFKLSLRVGGGGSTKNTVVGTCGRLSGWVTL